MRNDLHQELMIWEEPLAQWEEVTEQNFDASEVAPKVADLYRFLAPLYAPVDEWERIDNYRSSGETRSARPDGAGGEANPAAGPAAL